MYACMYVCMYVCVCVCMYVHVYVHVCMHIHVCECICVYAHLHELHIKINIRQILYNMSGRYNNHHTPHDALYLDNL